MQEDDPELVAAIQAVLAQRQRVADAAATGMPVADAPAPDPNAPPVARTRLWNDLSEKEQRRIMYNNSADAHREREARNEERKKTDPEFARYLEKLGPRPEFPPFKEDDD